MTFLHGNSWSLPGFLYISYFAWDGKVVWLHMCNLATIEAHSRALESGFLKTLMWYAGFMQNSARWLHLSPGKHSPLAFIANPSLLSGLLPVYAADRYMSVHICSSVHFYYTFMIFYRCTVLRPEDTEPQPAVHHIHLSSISFNSIQVWLYWPHREMLFKWNSWHAGAKTQPNNRKLKGKSYTTDITTHNWVLIFRRQQVTILITDKNNGNIDDSKTDQTSVLVLHVLSEAWRERLLFTSLHKHK